MAVQNRIKIQNITYPELDIYVREREAQLKFARRINRESLLRRVLL